jgi:hypothetical protein
MNGEPWDDDRLSAAFESAFDRRPPTGLSDRTMEEIVRVNRSRSRRIIGLLAAAATIVVGVALAAESWQIDRVGPGPSGTVSGTPSSALDSPSPSPPTDGLDLPVIDVDAALAVRDLPGHSEELAVDGWLNLAATRGPVFCPFDPLPPSPLRGCGLEGLFSAPAGDGASAASFPIRMLLVRLADLTAEERAADWLRVVLYGHFDDRRASLCGEHVEQAAELLQQDPVELSRQVVRQCEDQFVVDQVASVDGRPTTDHFADWSTGTRWTLSTATASVAPFIGSQPILSSTAIPGVSIRSWEPALAADRQFRLENEPALWLFAVLDSSGQVDTYIVVDEIGKVFRSVGPSFERVDGWTDPAGPPTFTVVLGELSGDKALAQIWDRSGLMVSARAATAEDPAVVAPDQGVLVRKLEGRQNQVRLTWRGSVCQDYRIVLEANAALVRIATTPGSGQPVVCQAIAPQPRDVILFLRSSVGRVEADLLP